MNSACGGKSTITSGGSSTWRRGNLFFLVKAHNPGRGYDGEGGGIIMFSEKIMLPPDYDSTLTFYKAEKWGLGN